MKTLLSIMLIVTFANADMFTPSNSCYKPNKPYEFTDQWQVDSYNNEVQRYKNCIVDFVDEQNDAVNTHLNAKNEAIAEWNRFANYGS